MRCILWPCIIEKGGGTSCYFEDLGQWNLNFLILKFNLQHKSKIWMFLRVCKGWLFIHCWLCQWKCCPFALIHLCPLPASQAPELQVAVSYQYIFCLFFLIGIPLSNTSFPLLISSDPAQSPWSFSSASQFQLHTQSSSRSLCFLVKCCFSYPTYSLHSFPTIHTYCLSSQCIHSHVFCCVLTLSFPNTRPTQCHSFSCVFKAPCIYPNQ